MARKPDPAQAQLPLDLPEQDDERPGRSTPAAFPQEAPVDPSPRRGRPRKWASDAERKRAYRERLAADLAEPDRLRKELRNERRRVASRETEIARLCITAEQFTRKIDRLERDAVEAAAKKEALELQVEFLRARAIRSEKKADELRDQLEGR